MSTIKSFVPWIVFAIVTSATDWRLGLAAGLAAQLIAILTRKPRRVSVLEGAMLLFFAVMGVFAMVNPASGLQHHLTNVSMAWLAVVAVGSIVAGHPFTLDYSASSVPADVARSPLFIAINRTVAWAWAAAFAGIAAVGFIADAVNRSGFRTVAAVVMILAVIEFTKTYPDRAVAHHTPAQTPVGVR